jgi:hypothetical protein
MGGESSKNLIQHYQNPPLDGSLTPDLKDDRQYGIKYTDKSKATFSLQYAWAAVE